MISLFEFAASQRPQQSAVLIPPAGGGCIQCTSQAGFSTFLRGFQPTFIQCNEGGFSTYTNCVGCCSAYAIWLGKSAIEGAGFLSQNSQCICCTRC
ncbi:hypothetical protein Tcan_08992 [Toxocara canis]|uniref:Uncharacterized protein n=1 Tax=Toxocara canis TaxID=6265 RepID=A0A0B2VLG2_TOXCA|nr:hypothetical protein Tcan_08992 [Toxocara canis]